MSGITLNYSRRKDTYSRLKFWTKVIPGTIDAKFAENQAILRPVRADPLCDDSEMFATEYKGKSCQIFKNSRSYPIKRVTFRLCLIR